MTPYDAQQRQHGEQEAQLLDGSERDARPLNADAERALLRVRQKLKGLEGGALHKLQQLAASFACSCSDNMCRVCLDLLHHTIICSCKASHRCILSQGKSEGGGLKPDNCSSWAGFALSSVLAALP